MDKQKQKRPYLTIFLSLLKIGAFTFGGGYAMIALFRDEFVDKRHWITGEEFSDMVAIAESTPGPLAINGATYVGYKVGELPGALLGTAGVCLPSLVVIYVISLFFDRFLELSVVAWAFKGIQACVAYLILAAGIKMIRELPRTAFSVTLLILTMVALITLTLLSVAFSTVFYILIGGGIGVAAYAIAALRRRAGKGERS